MNLLTPLDKTSHIIESARVFGVSLSGITSMISLQNSPSYEIGSKIKWYKEAKSLLVLALVHETSEEELDWWDDKKGRTPGNRQLISMAKNMRHWLSEELDICAELLPYQVDKGGVFLKDAAVLSGLGAMGKNNLLITPEFGPRVRFRALFLDVDLNPTGPIDYAPCEECNMPCRKICPAKAFRDGSYDRTLCNKQMVKDEVNKIIMEKSYNDNLANICVKYCRDCELACPVGK